MRRARCRFQFRPGLEALESRRCLAGSLTQFGDLLIIRGDAADNQIAIVDAGADGVWAEIDGQGPHVFEGVRRIMIEGGGGADFCDGSVGGADSLVKQLTANLGAGDDHFSLHIGELAGRSLAVSVAGQGDDDLVGFHWGCTEGSLSLSVTGGDGNDILSVEQADPGSADPPGEFVGSLRVKADGGSGEDEVGIIVIDGSEGSASVMASGGGGDDQVGIILQNVAGTAHVSSGGGEGDDQVGIILQKVAGTAHVSTLGGAGDDQVGIIVVDGKDGSFNISAGGGAGDDVLTQDLQKMDANVVLACLGGAGIDIMSQKVELADSARRRTVKISGDGGAGSDALFAETTHAPTLEPRIQQGTTTNLVVSLTGGGGDDMIQWLFDGPEEFVQHTRVQARLDGGDGDDQVNAVPAGDTFVDPSNPNRPMLSLLGGNGDDQLGVIVIGGIIDPNQFPWIVDGGAGLDEALVPGGLRTRRCEFIILQ